MPSTTEDKQLEKRFVLAALAAKGAFDTYIADMGGNWCAADTGHGAGGIEMLLWQLPPQQNDGARLSAGDVGLINLDLIALMALVPCLPVRLGKGHRLADLRAMLRHVPPADVHAAAAASQGQVQMDIVCQPEINAQAPTGGGAYLRDLQAMAQRLPDEASLAVIQRRLKPYAVAIKPWQRDAKRGWVAACLLSLAKVEAFSAEIAALGTDTPLPGYQIKEAGPFVPLSFTPSLAEQLSTSAVPVAIS